LGYRPTILHAFQADDEPLSANTGRGIGRSEKGKPKEKNKKRRGSLEGCTSETSAFGWSIISIDIVQFMQGYQEWREGGWD
jgi:hypothetical protein